MINPSEKRSNVKIIYARIIEKDGEENKYVAYAIKVLHLLKVFSDHENPVIIERRYTHFLKLYTTLRDAYPELMSSVIFPKKALVGNFDDKLINARGTSFENLLIYITEESRLLYSVAFTSFLQDVELQQAKSLMESKRYDLAIPLLETNFRILSKVYTDRTKCVLLALCRLLGCCSIVPGASNALKWAGLAFNRYEGVSDIDLLTLYVPILQLSLKLCDEDEKELLQIRLDNLKRKGVNVDNAPSLLEAISALE